MIPLALPEVKLIEPARHADARGFFAESFNASDFDAQGIPSRFLQDNRSRSTRGVLRGLHYQLRRPQGKLVSVVHGSIFDVAVDVRVGSPTFGQWVGVTLDGDLPQSVWVPPGFAHGFCVLSESADVTYKCTDLYDRDDDCGVLWSDPRLGIAWPIADPLLSEKDRRLHGLDDSRTDLPRFVGAAL